MQSTDVECLLRTLCKKCAGTGRLQFAINIRTDHRPARKKFSTEWESVVNRAACLDTVAHLCVTCTLKRASAVSSQSCTLGAWALCGRRELTAWIPSDTSQPGNDQTSLTSWQKVTLDSSSECPLCGTGAVSARLTKWMMFESAATLLPTPIMAAGIVHGFCV